MNFSSLTSSSKDDNGNNNNNSNSNIGINRFYSTQGNVDIDIELEHSFAISIAPSSLRHRRNDVGNSKSIMLNYSPYQGILSPWKTMVDELRVLKPPPLNTSNSKSKSRNGSDNDEDGRGILLCVGSMAWSGGYWNGTPFLLVQSD